MFHAVTYNDKGGPINSDSFDCEYLENAYVKLYVEHKEHPYSFDRFMDKLYECGVEKITVIEEVVDVSDDEKEIVDLAQDTVTLINSEVDMLEEIKDKEKMKRLIRDLYMESLSQ